MMFAYNVMSDRPVTSFKLSSSQRSLLISQGFKSVRDFQGVTAVDLASELSVSRQEANEILKVINNKGNASEDPPENALGLLEKCVHPPILTFCQAIDDMLGGGVATKRVTEFCGVPGIGKTQLGIQLAVDVQIPPCFGGVGGAAVYIDTEGSFMVDRVVEIASSAARHITASANRGEPIPENVTAASNFTLESILANIHVFRVRDSTEQAALINTLPDFLSENPNVRLVVFDSVSFHFRHDFADYALRTRTLSSMANDIKGMAEKYDVAMVLMNQVTTKFRRDESSGATGESSNSSYFAPALGASWAHACTTRLMLLWREGQRCAKVLKSSDLAADSQTFTVVQDGIRGVSRKRKAPDNLGAVQ